MNLFLKHKSIVLFETSRPSAFLFYTDSIYGKACKNLLSKTIRPSALIFGMLHYRVNLYQECSNYDPGAKNGIAQGSHVLHRLI